ncbi:MAG: serine hydrolase [Blastocatellia bacterium]|nr:serine hydrolase [Blastocatellia bacterium]
MILIFFRRVAPLLALVFLVALPAFAQRRPAPYYPGRGEAWERKKPEQVGMDSALLDEAIRFAKGQVEPKSVAQVIAARQRQESHPEIIGPTKERGANNGLVLRHGYIVAEYGETDRVDMTFSVTKSFLGTIAGLSVDRGLIDDLSAPVGRLVKDGGFDSPHNARITWHQMLQQTNQWDGWLWEKPSAIDERKGHQLQEPGTFWNYNDVCVNRLSLALLRLWKQPLPQVLKERIMDPIGASSNWEWHGYRNSEVVIDGKTINSVSGGGHWGGGLFISTRDMARFGYLFLRRGKWRDRQLVSEKWVGLMTTPCPIKNDYGYLWWLQQWPGDAQTTFAARGAGGNVIWIDPNHDLVVVLRWTTNHDEIFKRIRAAVLPAVKKAGIN